MNEIERQLDLALGESQAEVRMLRRQLDAATEEAVRLRHKLERIYAISHLALHTGERRGAYEAPAADEGSTTD